MSNVIKSPLKWAGSKRLSVNIIKKIMADKAIQNDVLIEPFVGAGYLFLNTEHSSNLLNDINTDLIDFYKVVKSDFSGLVMACHRLFNDFNNCQDLYLNNRMIFNLMSRSKDLSDNELNHKAALFLYLNKHCHGGLCRYNKKGEFNVAYGKYSGPILPSAKLSIISRKLQTAELYNLPYADFLEEVKAANLDRSTIYIDPPYIPLSKTAKFTEYFGQTFTNDDQANLASIAKAMSNDNDVLISNHHCELSERLYAGLDVHKIEVPRVNNSKSDRRDRVTEVLAVF